MNVNIWVDGMLSRATELYQEGKSCGVVAKLLNQEFRSSISRNAVIGKLWRAGVTRAQVDPEIRLNYGSMVANPVRQKRSPIANGEARAPRKAYKAGASVTLTVVEPECDPIELIDLRRLSCRWPVFGEGADTRYCGRAGTSQPYCSKHRELAFSRLYKRVDTPKKLERSLRRYVA